MNIKEHIEAGHYPTDDKGRPLVPMKDGDTFVVCAADKPFKPIIGWSVRNKHFVPVDFQADGTSYDGAPPSLLPPPPRKAKVTRYAVMSKDGPGGRPWFVATVAHNDKVPEPGSFYVELTGEYEEPWS